MLAREGRAVEGARALASVGSPMPGVALEIRDDEGRAQPDRRVGRIFVESPSLMDGYFADGRVTAEGMAGGWLDTGDVMRADAEGYLWFCGRKKQIIVHDGSNICPQEVEEALLEHAAVESAGVVGVHDLVHGMDVGVGEPELVPQRIPPHEVGGRVLELGDDLSQLVSTWWIRSVVDDLGVDTQLFCNRDRVARRVSIRVVVDRHVLVRGHPATVVPAHASILTAWV